MPEHEVMEMITIITQRFVISQAAGKVEVELEGCLDIHGLANLILTVALQKMSQTMQKARIGSQSCYLTSTHGPWP